MALLSTLRVLTRFGSPAKASLRFSGHGSQMRIQPSRYMWNKFKDYLHFYILLGLVPLSSISLYCYIFIGPAQLTEIPEGYTPHYWEYYKHPISRFLAKYCLYDKTIDYETLVARMTEESEQVILKRIERELRAVMAENADHKSWWYRPYRIEDNRFQSEMRNIEPIRLFGIDDGGDKD